MGAKLGPSEYRRTRLKVFKNTVLKETSQPTWEEARADWEKLHTEKIHDLYSSPNIMRGFKGKGMKWPGNVAHMVKRNFYTVLVRKPEKKSPHG
jgi:hypothetical protein